MRLLGKTVFGEEIELTAPCYLRYESEEGVPADSLEARFARPQGLPELCELSAYAASDTPFFAGIVDEQIESLQEDGFYLQLACRGFAALLLDSEALPQSYRLPSLQLLYSRHAAPYGFLGVRGDLSPFTDTLQVQKGESEWGVLAAFCRDYLKVEPRVTWDKRFDAAGGAPYKRWTFGTGELPIAGFRLENRRCEAISNVYVRSSRDGAYRTEVKNPRAIARGIRRLRYLNAQDGPQTPVSFGAQLIEEGEKRAFSLTLTCPGFVPASVGDRAQVLCKAFGGLEELIIRRVCCLHSRSGAYTTVELRKNEET